MAPNTFKICSIYSEDTIKTFVQGNFFSEMPLYMTVFFFVTNFYYFSTFISPCLSYLHVFNQRYFVD